MASVSGRIKYCSAIVLIVSLAGFLSKQVRMTASANKGNLPHVSVYSINQYPVRFYMTVSMASQITSKGMVVVSAFEGLLIDELAHYSLQLLDVFAPLHYQPVISLKLLCGLGSKHYADIFSKNSSRLS